MSGLPEDDKPLWLQAVEAEDDGPGWGLVIFWTVIALIAVPAFLTYCGSF